MGSESSHGSFVVSDVNAVLLQEVSRAILDQLIVEVFSAQMGISGSGLYFENSIFDRQKRDIESSTSQIEDENVLFSLPLFVQSVGNSCGGGLVDDSQYVESSNNSGVFGGLSLRIIEISGNSDNSVFHWLGQIGFSGFFHLDQHHGRDFFGVEFLEFSFVFNADHGFSVRGVSFHFERPEFNVLLNN